VYSLTNKNIHLRYLAEKDRVKRRRAAGDRRCPGFSYSTMGAKFMVTKQACYEWTREKLPSGPRRDAVHQWINDGELDAFLRRMGHAD
jgi:hypothetical protein